MKAKILKLGGFTNEEDFYKKYPTEESFLKEHGDKLKSMKKISKSNNPTFADRARAIEKKYTRAKFDPIEKKDMESELDALMQEQEAYRQANGMVEQEAMPNGGKMQYATGSFINPFMLPGGEDIMPMIQENLKEPMPSLAQNAFASANTLAPISNEIPTNVRREVIIDQSKGNLLNTQYLPTIASGLSSAIGNLALMGMSKKQTPQITAPVANVERMNMEPYAQQMRRDAGVSRNINMRNARNMGLNPQAAMANMGAANAAVDRGLGANLTNLYGQQEQFNAGSQNQANLANMQAQGQTNQFNAGMKAQSLQDRMGFLGSIFETPGMVNREINQMKADKESRDILDAYYKSSGGSNYMAVGSIFKSNDGRFTYKVIGHNPDGTPITEKQG